MASALVAVSLCDPIRMARARRWCTLDATSYNDTADLRVITVAFKEHRRDVHAAGHAGRVDPRRASHTNRNTTVSAAAPCQ